MIKPLKALTVSAAIGLLSLSTSSWALFEDNDARNAINQLNKRMASVMERLSQLETANQGTLTLAQSLSEKDREIAKLRGELEVAQNSIRQLQEDLKTLYASLDQRLASMEPQAIELDGRSLRVEPDQYRDYSAALEHFKQGNFAAAQAGFAQFGNSYPSSPLLAQTKYFLGSALYAQGDYKAALITQRDLAKDHPDDPRAPDALLSMASSQLELKSIPGAKKTLGELIDKYPDSPAAESARSRLAAIK